VRTVKPTARDAKALSIPRLALGAAMVKESKFFRKQAKKAERMVRAISDAETAESLSNLAEAYRKQADVLKAKRKSSKKRR
jgi:hypothetical protein